MKPVSGTRVLLWIGAIPEAVWSPLAAALFLFVVGATALAAGSSWLFASLGPTAYLRAKYPDSTLARFRNTVVGHMTGLASGFIAVAAFDAWQAPVLPLGDVTAVRIWAVVLSIALTISASNFLRANHPPAAATTLLVALGTFKTALDAAYVTIGVLMLAILSEGFIRLRWQALRTNREGNESGAEGGKHG